MQFYIDQETSHVRTNKLYRIKCIVMLFSYFWSCRYQCDLLNYCRFYLWIQSQCELVMCHYACKKVHFSVITRLIFKYLNMQ